MNRRRRGYVLVMTLGLLVLASTLLVTIGRVASRRVLEARVAQSQLQRRWGAISCRSAVLPWSADILARVEAQENRPTPAVRSNVLLGSERFELIISDEQAKANINALLEDSDRSSVETRLRAVLTGSGLGNAIALKPEPAPSAAANARHAWISGYGQIFDRVQPDLLIGNRSSSPADLVTCWGDGAVNILRAPDNALRLAAGRELTEIEISRLIEARERSFQTTKGSPGAAPSSGDAVTNLLATAKIDGKVRANLAFVTTSTVHSMWVIALDRDRAWYQFSVRDDVNPKKPVVAGFEW